MSSSNSSDGSKASAAPGGFASSTSQPEDEPKGVVNFSRPTSPLVKCIFSSFGEVNREPFLLFPFEKKHVRPTNPSIQSAIATSEFEDELMSFFWTPHDPAKEKHDMNFRNITQKLPLPEKATFPRPAEEEVLLEQLERTSLLDDLVRIEGILQQCTAGYNGAGVEIEAGGTWIEGIYIASIQRKLGLLANTGKQAWTAWK